MSEELTIVQNLIYEIRGQNVMLDFDLARLYQVETKALNQAVKRNLKRFPSDFMFQLTEEEWITNSSQIVMTSNRPKSALPYAFTEQGVAMLASVLKSPIAVAASISIMRAFVQVRQYLLTSASMTAELKELRAKVDLLAMQQEENLGEEDEEEIVEEISFDDDAPVQGSSAAVAGEQAEEADDKDEDDDDDGFEDLEI